jgi:hypothetical protein
VSVSKNIIARRLCFPGGSSRTFPFCAREAEGCVLIFATTVVPILLTLTLGPRAILVALVGARRDAVSFRPVSNFTLAASLGVCNRLAELFPGFRESGVYCPALRHLVARIIAAHRHRTSMRLDCRLGAGLW